MQNTHTCISTLLTNWWKLKIKNILWKLPENENQNCNRLLGVSAKNTQIRRQCNGEKKTVYSEFYTSEKWLLYTKKRDTLLERISETIDRGTVRILPKQLFNWWKLLKTNKQKPSSVLGACSSFFIVKNYHKPNGLRQHKFILLQFWGSEI